MLGVKYFLPVYSLSLILSTLSFAEQKFLTLGKYILLIISFMGYNFGTVSKSSSPNLRPSTFFPMVSPRSYIVLHITFNSVIHFELFFCEGHKIYV